MLQSASGKIAPRQSRVSLASITSKQKEFPPRIGIYGLPGIGKTTFAAHAPNPIFITAEDGIAIAGFKNFFENEIAMST